MTTAESTMIAHNRDQWGTGIPLSEQQHRASETTKTLVDKAAKTYGKTLRRELKKLEKREKITA